MIKVEVQEKLGRSKINRYKGITKQTETRRDRPRDRFGIQYPLEVLHTWITYIDLFNGIAVLVPVTKLLGERHT